jgi:hypothetical protein
MKHTKPLTPRQCILNVLCCLLVASVIILLAAVDGIETIPSYFANFGALVISCVIAGYAFHRWYTPGEKEKRCASERIDWSASEENDEIL